MKEEMSLFGHSYCVNLLKIDTIPYSKVNIEL